MGDKKLVVGLLAHVDAGKTTLAEQILYRSGMIRRLGRVDHRDAFLDTDRQERERGITIFSKQASFTWKDLEVTLLDTPGHVDFAAEMEAENHTALKNSAHRSPRQAGHCQSRSPSTPRIYPDFRKAQAAGD